MLHLVWATGWYVGLSEESARQAFQQTWFLAYDLCVAVLCVFGAAVALALVRPWGRRFPRGALGALVWGGAGLLAVRAAAGALQTAYFAATGVGWSWRVVFWDLWFCLGAILFGLSAWLWWPVIGSSAARR